MQGVRVPTMKPYYESNGVTLFLGDCREVMPELNMTVDAIICDPPYGTTSNKWDSPIPLGSMWEQLARIGKSSAAFIFTASQPFTSALVLSKPDWFRHEWIWIKNRGSNFANTCREPMKEHESVLVFSRGKWTYNKIMQERTGAGLDRVAYGFNFRSQSENYRNFEGREGVDLGAMRVPSSWQKFNTEVGLHPTQKPVSLFDYLVRTYTNPHETVLDFSCGSGTTLVACARTGRKSIGIELEEKYAEIAAKRLSQEVLSFE
jgi:site-specific DNA-methyltransferase (adenine-specific)